MSKTRINNISALILSLLLIGLEIWGLIVDAPRGAEIFYYFTEDCNIFCLIATLVSAVFLIFGIIKNKPVPHFVKVLRFMATVCTTLTFIVVAFILTPMFMGFTGGFLSSLFFMMTAGSCLQFHFLCPVVSFLLLVLFEREVPLKSRDFLFGMLPILVYAAVFIPLNILKIYKGPYPFFYVYEQPIFMSVIWFVLIMGGALAMCYLLAKISGTEKPSSTKYLVLLMDGMADTPNESLGGKTPMEAAHKPNIDALALKSELGLANNVPNGFKPGSDVANLSVMGFNPEECYTGRSPLEAASIGIDLADTDVTLRCNLVTLSCEENYADKTMIDYSADDISTEDADVLIKYIDECLGNDVFKFYTGTHYRHCLVVKNGSTLLGRMTPPHDISDRVIKDYLSTAEKALPLIDLMKKSYDLLSKHPLNIEREKKGLKPANSIWLWGEGTKPQIENFYKKYGVKGAVISAVDLLKGIAKCADMERGIVEGATGYIDTNFVGKEKKAEELFLTNDLVYIHLEAPDECGHRGEIKNKVKSIELIDELVAGPIFNYLKGTPHKILICPDHPTPLDIKTHTMDPVPYLLYDSENEKQGAETFTEATAKATGNVMEKGHKMMAKLLSK